MRRSSFDLARPPFHPHLRLFVCSRECDVLGGGDAWCDGKRVCFPSLPPMLFCGFESHWGLESSDFSMWHFLTLVARGFLRVLRFPPLLHRFNGSANKNKAKIYAI